MSKPFCVLTLKQIIAYGIETTTHLTLKNYYLLTTNQKLIV